MKGLHHSKRGRVHQCCTTQIRRSLDATCDRGIGAFYTAPVGRPHKWRLVQLLDLHRNGYRGMHQCTSALPLCARARTQEENFLRVARVHKGVYEKPTGAPLVHPRLSLQRRHFAYSTGTGAALVQWCSGWPRHGAARRRAIGFAAGRGGAFWRAARGATSAPLQVPPVPKGWASDSFRQNSSCKARENDNV